MALDVIVSTVMLVHNWSDLTPMVKEIQYNIFMPISDIYHEHLIVIT